MTFSERREVCPVCGEQAKVTRKWVMNKYSKRYDYFIYHHQGTIHYSNQDQKAQKYIKKGELERALIETINSQNFRLGLFRNNDVRKLLVKNFSDIGFGSIKVSLERLAKIGMIEKHKKGRSLYYINTVSKDRLSFVIISLKIGLVDIDKDNTFKKHVFTYIIKNDHSWPLYYVPFRYVGDVDMRFEELELHATDASSSKDFKVLLIEDSPTDKRVLLKMPIPLLPGELRDIKVEYHWPEPKMSFVFSAATRMDNFQFSISGDNDIKLSASLTLASRNETRELSNNNTETSTPIWKYISGISISDVEPFSVLQFKWKHS